MDIQIKKISPMSERNRMIKSLPAHIREKLNDDQLYIHLNLFIKFDKDGSVMSILTS